MTHSRRARNSTSRSIHTLAAIGVFVAAALPSAAQNRLRLPPHGSNAIQQSSLLPGLATQDMATGGQTADSLVQALVGAGVTVTNVQYNGELVAAGTFTGGTGIIGFAQGIIMSSGSVGSVVGPQNLQPSTSTDNARGGDADLDALVGGLTQDAVVLEFDFECPNTSVFSFQYVFASEEYDEWVNTQYNDVFAFFLNGQNIALIPGTTTPVAINNVNCGNPYNPSGGLNCALYRTNACDSLGMSFPCTNIATEMDGLTAVFSATGTLHPGPNHIKLAIADRGDGVYDSNVFIRGESFVCAPAAPAFDPPSPCGQTLIATVGVPFHFEVEALATNGLPGEAVSIDVTGDPVPLAGGTFTPPLPTVPAPEVSTEFDWTPQTGDVGIYQLQFTATDQVQQSSTCDVTIDVRGQPGTGYCFGDGSSTPCPCGNVGGTGRGCPSSVNQNGARLVGTGVASVATDTLTLRGSGMPDGTALYFQGTVQTSAVFGDGLRCVSGTQTRLGIKTNVSSQSEYPTSGDLPISVRGAVPAGGGTRMYQCWYRNADPLFCTPSTFNLTNGYSVNWTP
jgi:hypothetical protein